MEKSKIFRINIGDVGRGIVVAVFAAVLAKLAAVVNVPGFQFASFDYTSLIGVAISACVGYLSKNFFTSEQGNLLGLADKK